MLLAIEKLQDRFRGWNKIRIGDSRVEEADLRFLT